jgi:hypothetical protein
MCSIRQIKNHSTGLMFLAFLLAPLYAPASDLPPDPITLFRDLTSTFAASDSVSVHVEKQYDVVMLDGAKIQYGGALDILVKREGRLHVNYGDDISAKELWYDGSTLTLIDHLSNVYTQVPTKGEVGDMLVDLAERYGLDMPLAPLLEPSVAREFETYLESATYLGLHDIEGEACHHVLYRGANVDLQIWATTDETPLLRKLVVTFWKVEGAPQKVLVFSDWNLDAETDSQSFKASIPKDAIQTEFLPKERAQHEIN